MNVLSLTFLSALTPYTFLVLMFQIMLKDTLIRCSFILLLSKQVTGKRFHLSDMIRQPEWPPTVISFLAKIHCPRTRFDKSNWVKSGSGLARQKNTLASVPPLYWIEVFTHQHLWQCPPYTLSYSTSSEALFGCTSEIKLSFEVGVVLSCFSVWSWDERGELGGSFCTQGALLLSFRQKSPWSDSLTESTRRRHLNRHGRRQFFPCCLLVCLTLPSLPHFSLSERCWFWDVPRKLFLAFKGKHYWAVI